MTEEIYDQIYQQMLSVNFEEKKALISKHVHEFSESQLLDLMKAMDIIDFFKMSNYINDNIGRDMSFASDYFFELIEKNIGLVNFIKEYQQDLEESGQLEGSIADVAEDIENVIQAIKEGIPIELLAKGVIPNLNKYEFDVLSEDDKQIFGDSFDIYLPGEILRKICGRKIEDINEKKLSEISRLDDTRLILTIIKTFPDSSVMIKAINESGNKLHAEDIIEIIEESQMQSGEKAKILNEYSNILSSEQINQIAFNLTGEEKKFFQKQLLYSGINFFKDENLEIDEELLENKLKKVIMDLLATELGELKIDINDVKIVFEKERDPALGSFSGSKMEYRFNLSKFKENMQSPDSKFRLDTIKFIFEAVFHEVQHHRQKLMSDTGVSNKKVLEYSREEVLHRYLNGDFYLKNHDSFSFEADANVTGRGKVLDLLDVEDYGIDELFFQRSKYDNVYGTFLFDNETYATPIQHVLGKKSIWNSAGEKIDRTDATIKILDSIPSNLMKSFIKRYPILGKQYSEFTGNRFNTCSLIVDMENELEGLEFPILHNSLTEEEKRQAIKSIKEMYYEIIYQALEKDSIYDMEASVDSLGRDKVKKIFEEIKEYFERELQEKLQTMEETIEKCSQLSPIYYENENRMVKIEENGEEKWISTEKFIESVDFSELPKIQYFSKENDKIYDTESVVKEFVAKYINEEGKIKVISLETSGPDQDVSVEKFCKEYLPRIVNLTDKYSIESLLETIMQTQYRIICNKQKESLAENYSRKMSNIQSIIERLFGKEHDDSFRDKLSILKSAIKLTETIVCTSDMQEQGNKIVAIEKNDLEKRQQLKENINGFER